jgi:hypothetical protein
MDRRPGMIAQRRLAEAIHASPRMMSQRRLVEAVHSSSRMAAQRRQLEGLGVMQRVVSASATYVPQQAALDEINDLDAEIPGAEQAAANEIRNPAGGMHTARQATYIFNPHPMTWGYCVEEQLDPQARTLGWSTQYGMPGARPDYHRRIGLIDVFADLTTAAQAAPAGNHITGKLSATAHNYNTINWQAADVTHSGQRPGGGAPAPIRPNGNVTLVHAQRFQAYKRYLNRESAYDPVFDQVERVYGNISSGTFTQTWDEQDRDNFVDAFSEQVDSEESEYHMDPDEENM